MQSLNSPDNLSRTKVDESHYKHQLTKLIGILDIIITNNPNTMIHSIQELQALIHETAINSNDNWNINCNIDMLLSIYQTLHNKYNNQNKNVNGNIVQCVYDNLRKELKQYEPVSRNLYIKRSKHCCTYSKCMLIFASKTALNNHIRSAHRGKPYQCKNCKAKFNYHKELKQHINVIHKKKYDINSLKIELKKCPQCHYQSVIPRNVCYHIKNKHPGLLKIFIKQNIIKVCSICNWYYHCKETHNCRSFEDKSVNEESEHHLQADPLLDRTNYIRYSMISSSHEASDNDEDTSVSLLNQVSNITYECPKDNCHATFIKSYLLNQHIRCRHKGKPYNCENCHMLFAYNKQLQLHRLTCKVYCICKRPKHINMIKCIYCGELYHYQCVGINTTQALEIHDYKCSFCKAKKYCICNKADDGTLMVQCDSCNDWFHHKCINLSIADIEKLKEYVCNQCVRNSGLF